MGSTNLGDKLASQPIKAGPTKAAWWNEEIRFEIDRLKAILRDSTATDEEKCIAESQIVNYQDLSMMAARPLADWVRQMYLLTS